MTSSETASEPASGVRHSAQNTHGWLCIQGFLPVWVIICVYSAVAWPLSFPSLCIFGFAGSGAGQRPWHCIHPGERWLALQWARVENAFPAATWKCSLSPSLHPRTGNTSQLMLANRLSLSRLEFTLLAGMSL